MSLIENVRVVVREFFTWSNVAKSIDPDAIIVDHGIAVRIARVIYESRLIAADRSIDHHMIIDREEVGVMPLFDIVWIPLVCFGWSETLSCVFDQASTRTNGLGRKCAEPLDWRLSYLKRVQAGAEFPTRHALPLHSHHGKR